jgi:hypothetical protein
VYVSEQSVGWIVTREPLATIYDVIWPFCELHCHHVKMNGFNKLLHSSNLTPDGYYGHEDI